MARIPILILGLTVCLYWGCVGAMILRVRRHARGMQRVLIPSHWLERIMWVIWVPVVFAWMVLPWVAASSWGRTSVWIGLPDVVASSGLAGAVRILAALLGIVCLVCSMVCWNYMGRDWRMGVDPAQRSRLLVNGPFAKVRHPIYALSILLMLCSVIVLPAPVMAVMAAVHIGLMMIKARNEERFLLERHGQAYADYCARTRRFFATWQTGYKTSPGRPVAGAGDQEAQPTTSNAKSEIRDPKSGKLNSFQKVMLLWEGLHPYNAVHALCLTGASDVPALRRAIEQTCRRSGLGELTIDEEAQTWRYLELKAISLVELPPSPRPEETLAQVIDEGMNARFGRVEHPLRWTVFDEADRGAHHIVLAYRHVASDASGIEALLAIILREYVGGKGAGEARLSPVVPPGALPLPASGLRFKLRRVLKAVALARRFRHAHKMPDERDMGDGTAVVIRSFPGGAFEPLSAACRMRGVGLNDAFLAALASAIAERTPHRRDRRHRHALVLGSVASMRKWALADLSGCFGVFLSDMVVMLESPDDPMPELLLQVAAQTRARKADRSPETGASAMQGFVVRNIWPILDIPNHRRSYRKILPICGGVSTFAIDPSRFGEAAAWITRYVRACPPGAASPMVLAPTVFAGRLELSLVYRLSCLTPDKAADLLDGVCGSLMKLISPVQGGTPAAAGAGGAGK